MHTTGVHGGEERISYLLDVAAELFLRNGFAATSVGEIAALGRASKSTFYNRFQTKERLFTEVFRRRADVIFQEFHRILIPNAEPREVLYSLGETLTRCVLAPDSINLLRLVYMESKHIPELGRIYYAFGPERGRTKISAYLQTLVERKFFRADMDTDLGAEQFNDLIAGELIRRCALSLEPAFTPEERTYRLNAGVDMFIRSYKI